MARLLQLLSARLRAVLDESEQTARLRAVLSAGVNRLGVAPVRVTPSEVYQWSAAEYRSGRTGY